MHCRMRSCDYWSAISILSLRHPPQPLQMPSLRWWPAFALVFLAPKKKSKRNTTADGGMFTMCVWVRWIVMCFICAHFRRVNQTTGKQPSVSDTPSTRTSSPALLTPRNVNLQIVFATAWIYANASSGRSVAKVLRLSGAACHVVGVVSVGARARAFGGEQCERERGASENDLLNPDGKNYMHYKRPTDRPNDRRPDRPSVGESFACVNVAFSVPLIAGVIFVVKLHGTNGWETAHQGMDFQCTIWKAVPREWCT